MREVDRVLLQAPTGFGKTVVAAAVVQSAARKGKRALFLVHRDELLVQASRTFNRFDVAHGFLSPAYTYDPTHSIYVGMVDTVRSRLKSGKVRGRFDLVIADECHHATSNTWREVLDHCHGAGAKIIGLSATPVRLDGRPLLGIFDRMVLGPQVRELIESGDLASYDYYAPPLVDASEIKQSRGDYDQRELADLTDRPKITGDAIAHYQRLLPGKRAIVFCVTIEHAKHVAAAFAGAGVPAAHIDGMHMSREERRRVVRGFEDGRILVMTNVGIATEGFDVAACDAVILLRATASLGLHMQMVGRAMRPHGQKVAVILDHVGNWQRHGLPDKDRDWTLEGRVKGKRRKRDDEEPVEMRQCDRCFIVHAPAPACPSCGYVYPVAAREIVQVDGTLQRVVAADAEKAAIAAQRKKEVSGAKSLADLERLAEQRGYSKAWAKHVFQARARKRASFGGS